MNRDQKLYLDASLYEAFMKRVYRMTGNVKTGCDSGEFRLLEFIENGYYGKKGDYPGQVRKLKAYLAEAIELVQKWKLSLTEREEVDRYAADIRQAPDGDGLAEAIDGLLEATQRFKDY
ncbi:hypothetical protein [Mucilaginibacter phyllosphaerae]